jgi:membrane protein YdbS with pleckstrin-like domain
MNDSVFLQPTDGHGLSPKVKTIWFLQRMIWLVVFMVGLAVYLFVLLPRQEDLFKVLQPYRLPILVGWFAIMHLPGLALLPKSFRNWRYQVTPEFLTISHGVIGKHRTILPLNKLQHIEMESGFFESRMGIVQVEIHNAGGTNSVRIPGVTSEQANALRDEVMRLKGTAHASI